ncbi:MAG: QcrA and Rieske domain-containing protein [Symbiobacteriia bacterium]
MADEEGPSGITRRALLSGGVAALALAGLGLMGPLMRLAAAPQPGAAGNSQARLDLGSASDLLAGLPADGAWQAVPSSRYWLRREDRGVQALLGTCTHLGCGVKGQGTGFTCPCHGSRYDGAGQPIQGPARSPLTHLALSQDSSGHVWLDPRSTVAATFRLSL